MLKKLPLLALLCAVILGLPSCVAKKKFVEMTSARDALSSSLSESQAKVAELETSMETLETECKAEAAEMSEKVSNLENELGYIRGDVELYKGKSEAATKEVTDIKTQIRTAFSVARSSGLDLVARNGRLYIRTSQPILYKSGSARLTKEDKALLEELSNTLKSNPNLQLLVEGHTDNAQMIQGAAYRDNWDLGYARARRVMDMMVDKGVAPGQLSIVSRGEYMPVNEVDPDSKETRADNRRIEFIVVADAADLYYLK